MLRSRKRMRPTVERFSFAKQKYGRELHADAGRIEAWTGFVRDDRAHQLDFHELLYVEHGRGHVWLDDRRAPLEAGGLVLTAPNQMRRFEIDRPLEGYILLFTPQLSQGVTMDVLGTRGARWLHEGRPGVTIGDDPATRIRRLLDEMRVEAAHQAPDSPAMLRAQLAQLMVLLNREWSRESRPLSTSPLLHRLQALIDRHYRREHRPSFYAGALGLTADHLNAVVRRETGHSTGQLIAHRLFLEARRLLLHTDTSIVSIAGELGFVDQSYFARAFRRIAGCSPSSFRVESRKSTGGSRFRD
jgi:AraC family transcriptional activator of pobA